MNIIDVIKQRIFKRKKFERLLDNPNSPRYDFISDANGIMKKRVYEYKIWFIGDSDELLNYYTSEELYGNYDEPIYNRNKRRYFWGQSSKEVVKRIHSGIPNAIINTLTNVIGVPSITTENEELDKVINEIMESNDFNYLLTQKQMPMTMVQGWGAFKINFDIEMSKYPIIQYYEAEDVELIYKSNFLVGIVYRDFYRYENKDYVLYETRRVKDGNSLIEFELFRLEKNNELTPVDLDTIPELAGLESKVIPNFNKVLGVPSKFFYDSLNKDYGKSLFAGKIDLFDDLDQVLSQASQTVKVSTPVEYFPVDLLERKFDGRPKLPNIYNRQFIQKQGVPNGDGSMDTQIQTTQPNLNFEQYSIEAKAILDFILTGLLSPATMGIDIAKKDNADAQREKEKVTIMTRNNIIDRQTKIVKQLLSLCLSIKEYIDKGVISLVDYNINVDYDEFANPSFENELQILGQAWVNGQISTEIYVDMLYGSSKTEEEKAKEVAWLDNNRNQDNLGMGDFENGDNTFNEIENGTDLSFEEEENKGNPRIK